jgi:transcriptional regulator with XRE-family HTH domain
MKLDQYLSTHGLSDTEFGERISRSRSAVSRLRRGETNPDWDTAQRIFEATNGDVTPTDFLENSEAAE